ncbi:MAG: DUF1824 family protein [Coleofasciculaceae cyanobacterium SM2_1_6]|nr:DUF1824 family protein [Coleofasciculaceae cyanobacterium SM2_1_6]
MELSLAEALELLQSYSCKAPKLVASDIEKVKVQAAILLVAGLTDHQNLGICAEDVPTGLTALVNYAQALGYKFQPKAEDQSAEISPVYIKFNPQKQSYYLDVYPGNYRGVLISCQSSEHESLNATFGHFPLDLF